MFRLLRASLCATLLFACASIGRAADEKLPQTTPYYPLQVGSSWQYKTNDKEATKVVLKVTGTEKLNDTPCAKIVWSVGGKEVRNELIAVQPDGVYRLAFGQSKPDAPVRILKLPLKADDRWTVEGKTTGVTFKGTFKVGPEETIKVPAGEYKAFPVSIEDLVAGGVQATSKIYYAKDVGMVKFEFKSGKETSVGELEKYTPAGK